MPAAPSCLPGWKFDQPPPPTRMGGSPPALTFVLTFMRYLLSTRDACRISRRLYSAPSELSIFSHEAAASSYTDLSPFDALSFPYVSEPMTYSMGYKSSCRSAAPHLDASFLFHYHSLLAVSFCFRARRGPFFKRYLRNLRMLIFSGEISARTDRERVAGRCRSSSAMTKLGAFG
jgi:hypothetical protein